MIRSAHRILAMLGAAACLAGGAPLQAWAEDPPQTVQAYLEVTLNGTPRHLVSHFSVAGDGTIGARADELSEIGLQPGGGRDDRFVPLAALPGVTYVLDMQKQTIAITAPVRWLATHRYDLGPLRSSLAPDDQRPFVPGFGTVLNYTLYASTDEDWTNRAFAFDGASLTLESRTFTPRGTFDQSAILGNTTVDGNVSATRLDSSFVYTDSSREMAYRAGDFISGGLAWTRPLRLGGVQVQRDFALRPDLVTAPLPSISGTAAVPSALNVYVNGVQTFSQQVPAGPYQVSNLPAVTGAGDAHVTLRNASGQQVQEDVPYFFSTKLLRQGLYDYSIEAGAARLNYGASSFAYDGQLAGSASGRYGLTDWLTLEGHGEAADRFGNIGAGFDVKTGTFGALSVAGAASLDGADRGAMAYASYQVQVFGLAIDADSQRSFGAYRDLAAVTAPIRPHASVLGSLIPEVGGYLDFGSVLPPRAVDRISVGFPLNGWKSSVNASLTHYVDADGERSQVAALSYNQQLPHNATFFATAFHDFDDKKDNALLFGLSMPVGSDISVSTTASTGSGGTQLTTQASKALSIEPGSFGWSLSDTEGHNAIRSATANYQSSYGLVGGQVTQVGSDLAGNVNASGSIVWMPGADPHAGPRIDDAFAIVKAGAPGVPVELENRPAGVTGADGELLVTGLRSNDTSKIDIGITDLPANAAIARTKASVTPINGAGSIVDFGVDVSSRPLTTKLVDASGKVVPAGSEGLINTARFVVGYDGEVFFPETQSHNVVTINLAASQCHLEFDATPPPQAQIAQPLVCR